MSPLSLLVILLVCAASADQESCQGRCLEGFNSKKKCQCDELCSYYKSCCIDYAEVCRPQVTRGDVFALPEDEYSYFDHDLGTLNPLIDTSTTTTSSSVQVTTQASFQPMDQEVTQNTDFNFDSVLDTTFSTPSITLEEEEEVCSGKPFDAFTDLKNGSLFAFRGRYCYELDETSVLPGYPKLIRDIWGIEGPIDAAFTRINCQGKTYLFKGSLYWRFEDGILDSGYPRNISDGFKNIPDNIDAAVALPAHSYSGQERAYFFKGNQYWEYEFKQQPSQEECDGSEMSTVFEHFAILQQDSWQSIFELLFWNSESDSQQGTSGPWFISQDWHGVPNRVDAAMAGRIYLSSSSLPRSDWAKKRKAKAKSRQRNRKRYRTRKSRQRHSRRSRGLWSWFSSEEDGVDYDLELSLDWFQPSNCEPIQSIYFFVGDKYYRVNLRTKKVDFVDPPYPRPIAPYWLGCPPLRAIE